MCNDIKAKIADLLNSWADRTGRNVERFDGNDWLYILGKVRYDFNADFATATNYLRVTLREVYALTY
jgi:Uma2 family endonuclease